MGLDIADGARPAEGAAWAPAPLARTLLVLLTTLAVAVAGLGPARAPSVPVDPDLVRVIRAMALIKGAFALAALAGCLWRLARPASAWRTAVYVAGPPLMTAGAIGLWSLQGLGGGWLGGGGLGVSALGLHLGLFAVLAAGLTDADIFAAWPGRAGTRGRPGRR